MLKYPEFWEQVERDVLKVPYGRLTFEVEMQDSIPTHAALINERRRYICPRPALDKRKEDLV